MLEIIALIWLAGKMGKKALTKGLSKGWWQFYTVIGWIIGEVLGIIIAVVAFQSEDYIAMLPMALLGAVGGYLVVRAILSNKPDKPQDTFEFENNAGNNQQQ